MNIETTPEQEMLRDSVRRFVEVRFPFQPRADAHAERDEMHGWSEMAELGLLGLPFAETDGGMGGGGLDVALVMEAFGKGLVKTPFLGSVVMAGNAVALAGSPVQRAAVLPGIAEGSLVAAFAHAEKGARSRLDQVACRAVRNSDGWVISGAKTLVLSGASADRLIVSARSNAGVSLFLVDADAAGVTILRYLLQDGSVAAVIRFEGVRVEADALIGQEGQGLAIVEDVVDLAIAAIAAEAVGVLQEMLDLTVEYIKTRKQFGVALATFQVLQHRCVDMLVAVDQARSMALLAATCDGMARDERRRTLAAVKVQTARSLRMVSQQAVQLHGGIGMTLEYKLGHLFLRSAVLEMLFGDADFHLARLAAAGGLIMADD